jgi:hypothetical protein
MVVALRKVRTEPGLQFRHHFFKNLTAWWDYFCAFAGVSAIYRAALLGK